MLKFNSLLHINLLPNSNLINYPGIEPGYLRNLIPAEPPQEPEPWENVMKVNGYKNFFKIWPSLLNIYMILSLEK